MSVDALHVGTGSRHATPAARRPRSKSIAGAAQFEWAASQWMYEVEVEGAIAGTSGGALQTSTDGLLGELKSRSTSPSEWAVVKITASTLTESMGRLFSRPNGNLSSTKLTSKTTNQSIAAAELLKSAYGDVARGAHIEAYRLIADALEDQFATDTLEFANEVLRQLKPKLAGKFLATGILRSTFRVRSQLSTWSECAAATAEYLQSKNEDVQRAMRGLIAKD